MLGLGHAVFPLNDTTGDDRDLLDLLEAKCLELATFLLKTGGAPDLVEQDKAKSGTTGTSLDGRIVNNYNITYQSSWGREVTTSLLTR